jgi:hypothetical protein
VNPLLTLLLYRGPRPDPLKIEQPISARFVEHKKFGFIATGPSRLVVISADKLHWRAALATFNTAGVATFGEVSISPLATNRDAVVEWLKEFSVASRTPYVALGIGYGFSADVLNAIGRPPDVETMRLLRTDPARLLGDTIGADDINDLRHHPRTESCSIRFSIKSQEISSALAICASAGVQVARLVGELAQMLSLAYANGLADRPDVRGLLLALPSSYLFVLLDQGAWLQSAYDPALDEHAVGTLIQTVQQAIPDGRLAYIDGGMPGFADLLHTMGQTPPLSLVPTLSLPSLAATILN